MADPGLIESLIENERPDANPAGERLRLIAGVGVDLVVRTDERPESGEYHACAESEIHLLPAAYGLVANDQKDLAHEEGNDGCLTEGAKQCNREEDCGKLPLPIPFGDEVLREKDGERTYVANLVGAKEFFVAEPEIRLGGQYPRDG